ncbi:MAG: tetratricopeptide repeat protein, partial [Methylovulum sp.]|nr:tetratricopeptide repeat protein [Methylovulum sp.]
MSLLMPKFLRISRYATALACAIAVAGCATTEEKKEKTDTYLQLGVRYMTMNRLELAKENLEKALASDPNSAPVHNALAFLYERIEKFP